MKRIWGLVLILLFTGCTFFETPEGSVELSRKSVHVHSEMPSATEEVVYCSADVKITNTGNKTIYDCTISAVAVSDKGIEHYVSMHYNVNIPPAQSLYVTLEWKLVKPIDTVTKTSTSGSVSSSSQSSTSTTSTTTKTKSGAEESGWNKSSVKILDCFFN